jgi:hypothetical protein
MPLLVPLLLLVLVLVDGCCARPELLATAWREFGLAFGREKMTSAGNINITRCYCCTALLGTPLHCTALYCTVLLCVPLHSTALLYSALLCAVLHCSVLRFTALHCSALLCVTLHCTVLWLC